MKPLLLPEEISLADRMVIDAGTASLQLMERAGAHVARAAVAMAGGAYGKRVAVVCGKGNNAGDGFVAARLLERAGAFPVVCLLEDPDSLSGDAAANFGQLSAIPIVRYGSRRYIRSLAASDVIIDAIFGTGFKGSLTGETVAAVRDINSSPGKVLSIDIPTGVDGSTGQVSGVAVRAGTTVTFGALKAGLVLYPGSTYAGEVEVADIGLSIDPMSYAMAVSEETDVARALLPRSITSHKRSVGTVLVVAGSVGMTGAAALTAKGALRMGAGLVTMATPSSVAVQLDLTVLEGTTLPLPETVNGTIEPSAVAVVLEKARAMDAVALGPGLTTDAETVEFVRKTIAELEAPVVIDADGINAFTNSASILANRKGKTILTPHPGELARLLGISTDEVQRDRIASARKAASTAGAVVLLKGYRTVVASPDGRVVVNLTGGPALATGGSGDVLCGICAALLAKLEDPFTCAWAGAWIHGRAGDLLAEVLGDRSVVAGDLPEIIPDVLTELIRPRQ